MMSKFKLILLLCNSSQVRARDIETRSQDELGTRINSSLNFLMFFQLNLELGMHKHPY